MTAPDGPGLFHPTPAVIGHRGAPLDARENTPEAFAAAHAAGATWVELDARRTSDGDVVVHHDPVLADGRVIVELEAGALVEAGVHRLADVLAALPAGLGVDVEVKNFPGEPDHDEGMAVVEACGRLLDGLERPALLTSFNPMVLLAAAEMGLPRPTGLLTMHTDLGLGLQTAAEIGCAVLCPHHTTVGLDRDGIALGHAAGMQVLAWTVDEPALVIQLARWGVDAICTNVPSMAVGALDGT